MTNQEKFDAAHTLYESLCRLKAKPSAVIFKRYFACDEEEAAKLLKFAENKSMNPRRWRGRNAFAEVAGKMNESECEMLFCAFRYCMGQMTGISLDFIEYATARITQIQNKWLFLMIKEITEAEEMDKKDPEMNWLGHECDKVEWLKFREVVRAELKKRGEIA